MAGITSDANVLTSELRAIAQRHRLQFGEAMPLEQLVMRLCDLKQAYTQYGGDTTLQLSLKSTFVVYISKQYWPATV